jgi:hypothetical protein
MPNMTAGRRNLKYMRAKWKLHYLGQRTKRGNEELAPRMEYAATI